MFSVILTKSPLYRVKNLSLGYTVSDVPGQKFLVLEPNCTQFTFIQFAKLGEHYHEPGDEVYSISISRYIMHPDYDTLNILGDLCMVELSEGKVKKLIRFQNRAS